MNAVETLQELEEELTEAKTQLSLSSTLRNLTPQQAVDYIENNVTTLAQAKTVLKIMARILIVLLNRVPNLKE